MTLQRKMKKRKPEISNHKKRLGREGLSFKKSYLVLLILLAQFVVIILTYLNYVQAFTWIYFASIIISFLASLRVMLKTKNPAAKASWILLFLLFPTFGFLIYFLAGGSDIHPRHKLHLKKIDKYADPYFVHNDISKLSGYDKENAVYLKHSANTTVYATDDVKYYATGETVFADIITSLHQAKKSIYLEFFIISRGKLFAEILDILMQKAAAGVDVRIIYDGFGSKDLMSMRLRKKLKAANIHIIAFHPIMPLFSFFLNYRDHRKLVIIDEKIAYLGGFNLADEYANIVERFGYWKDSGIRIQGDSVTYFTHSFLKMWMFVTKKPVDFTRVYRPTPKVIVAKSDIIMPYASAPYQTDSVARSFYMSLLNKARHTISIMTPYLIIDEAIVEILKRKVASGVRVNIILPGIPDKKIVYALSKANGYTLAAAGCHVYVYDEGFLHSKNVLIDDSAAVVGSINFDYRSFYQQYENALYLSGKNVVKPLRDDINETMRHSSLLSESKRRRHSLIYRIYVGFLKWISPLM